MKEQRHRQRFQGARRGFLAQHLVQDKRFFFFIRVETHTARYPTEVCGGTVYRNQIQNHLFNNTLSDLYER